MKSIVYSEIFDQAWKDMKSYIPLVAGLTLVYFLGASVASMIPYAGAALGAGLTGGYIVCLLRIRDGKDIGFSDFFWSFMNLSRFIHQVILSTIIFIGSLFGMLLFVIPGVWFIVASHLSAYIFVTQPEGANDAIGAVRSSINLTKDHWWQMFGLLGLIGVLNLFGILCFFFGVLVSVPLSVLVMIRAMEFFSQQLLEKSQTHSAAFVSAPFVPTDDSGFGSENK